MDYVMAVVFVLLIAGAPLYFWRIYRQAAVLGAASATLTPDDRLRVSLAVRLLEDARRELEKSQTVGHPDLVLLTTRTYAAESAARSLLRRG